MPSWERLIANAIACPARQLNRCTLGAAFGATGGMPEPVAGCVRTQQDDDGRQRYGNVVHAGGTVAVKPNPTLAFAELAKRGDHAGRLALPAACPALWPSAAFVGFQGLANGYELVLIR